MVHAICRPTKQITTLDVLQGLVLLGLLIAQAFGQLASPQPAHRLDGHHPDLPVQFIGQLLINGQFERMGSFLFGFGVYRCGQPAGPGLEGLNVDRIAQRLLIGLLGIGLSLSLLLGWGDLLVPYALLGFTLLYFRSQSVSSLLIWMVGLAGLAIGVTSFRPGLLGKLPGWHLMRAWLLPGRPLSQVFSLFISYELMMLGGLLVGKLGLWPLNPRLRVHLSLLQVGVLPVAFLVKGAWVAGTLGLVALPQRFVAYQPVLLALSGFLGPSLLTGVYLLDIGVSVRLTSWGWTRWLGRVGQLSVTNYVFQSILCALLLYGYGVAVSGPLPSWGRAGIVVGIYTLQLGFSRLWRKHYRQGPLEWVCRQWMDDKWGKSKAVTTA